MANSIVCQEAIYAKLHSVPPEPRINAELVKTLREGLGWSQVDLAAAANVDQSVVSRLEKGLAKNARALSVAAVAGALGVSVDQLFADTAAIDPVTLLRQAVAMLERQQLSPDGWSDDEDVEIRQRLAQWIDRNPLFADLAFGADDQGDDPPTWRRLIEILSDRLLDE